MGNGMDGVSRLREVRARFSDSAGMQAAVGELLISGFDRSGLTLPAAGYSLDEANLEEGVMPAATEDDARQMRTLGSSTAGAAAALAAAGITIATGGAVVPAAAAAILAGGAAGGATFAAGGAAARAEQQRRDDQAATGGLVLSVRTIGADQVAKAREIVARYGASDIETIQQEGRHGDQ